MSVLAFLKLCPDNVKIPATGAFYSMKKEWMLIRIIILVSKDFWYDKTHITHSQLNIQNYSTEKKLFHLRAGSGIIYSMLNNSEYSTMNVIYFYNIFLIIDFIT